MALCVYFFPITKLSRAKTFRKDMKAVANKEHRLQIVSDRRQLLIPSDQAQWARPGSCPPHNTG